MNSYELQARHLASLFLLGLVACVTATNPNDIDPASSSVLVTPTTLAVHAQGTVEIQLMYGAEVPASDVPVTLHLSNDVLTLNDDISKITDASGKVVFAVAAQHVGLTFATFTSRHDAQELALPLATTIVVSDATIQ